MSAPTKRADMIVHEREPYNAEPPRAALAECLITPVEVFYGRHHGVIPEIDPQAWRLRVGGLVGHAQEFSPAELQQRFVPTEVTATLQCAGNHRAGLMAYRDIPGQHRNARHGHRVRRPRRRRRALMIWGDVS